jgi:hypothetical protein
MQDKLFAAMEISFLTEDKKRNIKQGYYDHLAEIIMSGEGLLPGLQDPEEFVLRKLTPEEEEELYFKIGTFLNSLN